LTSLNNLTRQVQFLATGTSGTDFNIASSTATHTFNLPTASATNRGALSSADWTTFNNKQNALTNPITGTGASGQVAFFNGTTSLTGTNNFFWDTANNRLGIGLTNPQRSIEIYNTTADNHLRLSGNAPSVSMGEAVTGSVYQAKFGLVTTNGQFVSAGVAGDFVIISQTGATIIGTSSTEKMRVNTSGNVSINNTNDTYKLDVTGTGRYTGQLRLESTITDGTNTYTLPSATGTLALTSQLTGGTVTSVGLSSATSGVTIGSTPITTSGTITLAIATASGSQQGLLSSTDWTTFNNKQNALTNPVTGTGTTNYLPKFTGTSTIGDSTIQTDGTGNLMVGSANAGNAGSINISVGLAGTTSGGLQLWAATNQTHYIQFGDATSGAAPYTGYIGYAHNNDSLIFGTATTTKMTLDASGNLGLGVTPSAWGNAAGFLAFEMPSGNINSYGADWLIIAQNSYSNSSGTRIYKNTGFASEYIQTSSQHRWYTAPSGTAGNAISFTQAMTLDASGRLGIGVTSPTAILDINAGANAPIIRLTSSAVGQIPFSIRANIPGFSNAGFSIYDETAAANRFVISSTGNVGIGTTSPGARLDVLSTYSSDTTSQTIFRDNTGVALNFGGTSSGSKFLQAQDSTGATTYYNLLLNPRGGNVGIGTSSPIYKFEVNGIIAGRATGNGGRLETIDTTTGANLTINPAFNSNEPAIQTQSNSPILFATNNTERFRITSGGLVGIGTSAPGNYYSTKLVVAVGDEDGITIAGGGDNFLMFADGQTGLDRYRGFIHYSHDTNFLAFGSDGAERMRITSGGDLIVGATSIPGAGSSTTGVSLGASGYITAQRAAATVGYFGRSNDGELFAFYNNTTQVGNISVAASSTSYNTSSDYRLKQDFKDYNGLDLVNKIKTYDYEWKADKTRSYGVIAHELQSIINYAVTGVKDGKEMQQVDYSKIVPVLIKAIQEQQTQIEQLKNK
jgi:hypothetical protein